MSKYIKKTKLDLPSSWLYVPVLNVIISNKLVIFWGLVSLMYPMINGDLIKKRS